MSTLVKVLQKLDIQENRKEANLGIFIEIPQKHYPDKHLKKILDFIFICFTFFSFFPNFKIDLLVVFPYLTWPMQEVGTAESTGLKK